VAFFVFFQDVDDSEDFDFIDLDDLNPNSKAVRNPATQNGKLKNISSLNKKILRLTLTKKKDNKILKRHERLFPISKRERFTLNIFVHTGR